MNENEEIVDLVRFDDIDDLEIYRAAVAIFAAVAGVTHAPLDVARRDCLEQAKLLAKEVKGE